AQRAAKSTRRDGNEVAVQPAMYSMGSSAAQTDYIKTYKDAAVMEMNRGGIPASIILAQGLVESAAGQSELATQANNHFGIKCAGSWAGKTYYKQDDDRDADGKPIKSCFRVYSSVAEGFHDHGEFLRDPKKHNRYGFLFNLDKTDYKSWARGLQSAGYATSPTYANQLIDIIERLKIYEYDQPNATAGVQPALGTKPNNPNGSNPSTNPGQPDPNNPYNVPVVPPAQRIGRVNDVKVVLTRPNERLDDIAKLYNLNTLKVADYNERGYTPGITLKENTRIFIQAKRDRWRGRAAEHFVREDQTIFDISQLYGVKLEKLLARNGLRNGQEPAPGERIILKGARRKGDNVVLRDISNVAGTPGTPTANPGTNPNVPVAPSPNPGNKTTTTDDELFEIGGNQSTQSTPTTKPTVPNTKPSVSDTPYPSDPVPQTGNGGMQPTNPVVVNPPVSVPPGYHLVVKGDTMYNVSRKYNLSVAQLRQMNNMADDNIRIGQTLRVR
ncbi:MAG: glucosaminidase domain-containing protein, partial [Saprospiraceae bacterium]